MLGHRDAFAQQSEERGSLEWTRKDDFMCVPAGPLPVPSLIFGDTAARDGPDIHGWV